MYKIEQNMLDAIAERKNWKQGNTAIQWRRSSWALVTLHSNPIASIILTDFGYEICANNATFLEYPTKTTASRLRALNFKANIKNGIPYINDYPLTTYKYRLFSRYC